MARANSLILPRSTVTTNGEDSLPITPRLSWLGIGPHLSATRWGLLPREQQELQAHDHDQSLDRHQEDAIAHPVEEAAAQPGAGEHGGAEHQADRHDLPAEEPVARQRDAPGDVHREGA